MSTPVVGKKEPSERHRHLKRNLALVAIVVIAVFAVATIAAGFVFGLYGCFGGCGTIPHISSVTCNSSQKSCQVTVVGGPNSGEGIEVVGCSFTIGNSTAPGTVSDVSGGSAKVIGIPPNQGVPVFCSGYTGTAFQGGQIAGWIQMMNGYTMPFSSMWS
jgi:hypothetical protein